LINRLTRALGAAFSFMPKGAELSGLSAMITRNTLTERRFPFGLFRKVGKMQFHDHDFESGRFFVGVIVAVALGIIFCGLAFMLGVIFADFFKW
jgi:hypothetical protein